MRCSGAGKRAPAGGGVAEVLPGPSCQVGSSVGWPAGSLTTAKLAAELMTERGD